MAQKSIIEFDAVANVQETDKLYLVRGTGVGRDKHILGSTIVPSTLIVNVTGAIDLSLYNGDLVVRATGTITITFSNVSLSSRLVTIVNTGSGIVTLAGTIVGSLVAAKSVTHLSNGTTMYLTGGINSAGGAFPFGISDDAYVDSLIQYTIAKGPGTINEVLAYANTAPTGSSLIIDILKNGVSILSGSLSIAATANSGSITTFTGGATFVKGDRLSWDITQIGSTLPGSDIAVTPIYQ